MANFNTHLTIGLITSGTIAIAAYKTNIIGNNMLLLCTLAGTIGSLLPDIDLEHSKPVRVGFNIISIIMAFGAVITWGKSHSLAVMLLMWAGSFITMRYGILYCYSKSTVHRGVVHSIPYIGILGALTGYGAYYGLSMTSINSWLLGLFVCFGGLVHLTLDEVYSVNIMNFKVKRSFGSALKVFEINKWHLYALMYALLATLVIAAPSPHSLWEKISESVTWSALM